MALRRSKPVIAEDCGQPMMPQFPEASRRMVGGSEEPYGITTS
jgi:hypothetical protein